MYSSASRAGLGVVAMACDPMDRDLIAGDHDDLIFDDASGCWISSAYAYGGGSPPDISLTPTVINTMGPQPVPVPTAIAPASIDVTMIPQQLPPLTANVPAATPSIGAGALIVGGLLLWFATRGDR